MYMITLHSYVPIKWHFIVDYIQLCIYIHVPIHIEYWIWCLSYYQRINNVAKYMQTLSDILSVLHFSSDSLEMGRIVLKIRRESLAILFFLINWYWAYALAVLVHTLFSSKSWWKYMCIWRKHFCMRYPNWLFHRNKFYKITYRYLKDFLYLLNRYSAWKRNKIDKFCTTSKNYIQMWS